MPYKIVSTVVILLSIASTLRAQEYTPPAPEPQHEWLQQLAGEWEGTGEVNFGPGTPIQKSTGTESIRTLGNFWVIGDITNVINGQAGKGVLTIGYNPDKKQFVGTWIDSVSNMMWQYQGELDETKKILTLNTKGPSFETPGELANYRDQIELKSADHKIFSSSAQGKDGKWTTFMTIEYRRKTKEAAPNAPAPDAPAPEAPAPEANK